MNKTYRKMMKLLNELLKNSRRSDRELAKILGVSQPSISRMRNKLTAEGIIQEFTIIPNFTKLGYEIMALTCLKVNEAKMKQQETKAKEYMMKTPNIVLAGQAAQGQGMNGIMVSLHRSYSEFTNFINNHMIQWGDLIEDHFTILVSLSERVIKPFSLKYLADAQQTE